MEVYQGGAGYEVDFTLRETVFGPDDEVLVRGHYETESVSADKLAPLAPGTGF